MPTLAERDKQVLLPTYRRLAPEISGGEGLYLTDTSGGRYLDFFAGLAVNALGYRHPRIEAAIIDQLRRYSHVSNYFAQEPQVALAERLVDMSSYPGVFFCNSGTEAAEAAIKLSRAWGAAAGKRGLIGFEGGFHGRTMGPLSLMSQSGYRQGFAPFLGECRSLPFDDPEAFEAAVDESTCAVFLEFIQGEAGIRPVSDHMCARILALRERFGFLLVADEVQAGLGRTGSMFSFDHWNVRPDIVLIAKALGGGLPLGAILAREEFRDVFSPGMHGTTFGGNPVACAAGSAVLDVMREDNLIEHAQAMGAHLFSRLATLRERFPNLIRDVRGMGCMAGMELARDAAPIVADCLRRGLLVNATQGTVIRLLPPLILQVEHIDMAIEILSSSLAATADREGHRGTRE